jgi:uncharacterized membrane protein (DUF485 family)
LVSFVLWLASGGGLVRALDAQVNAMAITLKQRAFAGLWFMAAGAFPVLSIGGSLVSGVPRDQTFEFAMWFLVVPLLVTCLTGALLGAPILDISRVKSGWRAAFQGLMVSVISYVLYAILLSAREGYFHGSFTFGESFAQMLFYTLVVGSFIIGWLVAILGILAGWLLYVIQVYRTTKPAERRDGI